MPTNTKKGVKRNRLGTVGGEAPSNGAENLIELEQPYIASVELTGTADMLFHRWNCEAVEAKANAAKNSKVKKTDDVESYVWRNDDGELCIPTEYVRMAVVMAAKSIQDPRSPRKSGHDLYKASVIGLTNLSSLGVKDWDYLDKRRVVVQRAGVNRQRPAIKEGWKASFDFLIQTPEYIPPATFHEVLNSAGKFQGVGDFRPSYGRFIVSKFDIDPQG